MRSQQLITSMRQHADAICADLTQAIDDIESRTIASRPFVLAVDAMIDVDSFEYRADLALHAAAPAQAVPLHSNFAPLQENGHRFLLASDGLYLEVRRPWLHLIHCLYRQAAIAMPYGELEPKTELAFGRIGNILGSIRAFAAAAATQAPNEHAEMLVWNAVDQSITDMPLAILDATPASLRYEMRTLTDDECVVVDLHSHGALPAFFSSTDNADDAGSVKISGVLGGFGIDQPTAMFRLCLLGLYIPINVPVEKIFGDL